MSNEALQHSLQHSVAFLSIQHCYGFIPGNHSGLNAEFASHRIGSSIERIESVMCAKSMSLISSDGWWYSLCSPKLDTVCAMTPRSRELDVVRPREEALLRVRVLHELRALLGERRPERRSLVAGQPQGVRRHLAVRPSDHLELQVGHDLRERDDGRSAK